MIYNFDTFRIGVFLSLIFLAYPVFSGDNNGFIKFQDGTIKYGKVKIVEGFSGPKLIIVGDSIKYSLANVKRFSNEQGYFAVIQTIKKNDNQTIINNILVKRIIDADISVFCNYRTVEYSDQKASYEYFSKDGKDIKEVNYSNIKAAVSDNLAATNKLKQSRINTIIAKSLILSGSTFFIFNLAKSFMDSAYKNDELSLKLNSGVYIGGSIALSSFIPISFSKKKLEEAIDIYNNR